MGLLDGFPQLADLDDITYEELAASARTLISRYSREWTDYNVTDPGITFIELFSWLAEMQIYQLDQLTDANFLKFLKLSGTSLEDAMPARVEITLSDDVGANLFKAGSRVYAMVGNEKVNFEVEEDLTVIRARFKSIVTEFGSKSIDNTGANGADGIYFAAFGDDPGAGASLTLEFDKPVPGNDIQLTFHIFEKDLPPIPEGETEPAGLVELIWEYESGKNWIEFDVRKDTTRGMAVSGKITLSSTENKIKKIRCSIKKGRYEIPPLIEAILLNMLQAKQVETHKDWQPRISNGEPGQVILLGKDLLGHPEIQVKGKNGNWVTWMEKDGLEDSSPNDMHYIFAPRNGAVTFGNGQNGMIPEKGESIKIMYMTTLGPDGNISKGQIFRMENGVIIGKNLTDASGGKPAESIDDAKARAGNDCRRTYRAITAADYEDLVLRTPGVRVKRAKVIPNLNPAYPCARIQGTSTVVVMPYTRKSGKNPSASEGFLKAVSRHLESHRIVTEDIHVIGPQYVKISIRCSIRTKPRKSQAEVEKRVREALGYFLDPVSGGPDGNGWPFGRAVFPSEIYQRIDMTEGVDFASGVLIAASGMPFTEEPVKLPPFGLTYPGDVDFIHMR